MIRKSPRRKNQAITAFSVGNSPTAARQKMMLDRLLHNFRIVFQLHLLQEPRAMRAHRLHADVQLGGDLPRRLSGGDETKHLKLAIAETGVPLIW